MHCHVPQSRSTVGFLAFCTWLISELKGLYKLLFETDYKDWHENDFTSPFLTVTIKCPVDVEIIDKNGNVVLSLLDGIETETYKDFGVFFVIKNQETGDYEKIACFFSQFLKNKYDIKIKGKGSGTVNYSIKGDNGDGKLATYAVSNLPVSNKTIINTEASTTSTPYFSVSNDGEEYQVTLEKVTEYIITAIAGTGGTTTGSGAFNVNESVTLIATPNNGYIFDGWYESGVKVADANATYIFNTNSNRTLVARFIQNSDCAIIFNSIGGNGTLTATVDGAGISSGTSVAQGKSIIFTATPNSDYRIKEWKHNGGTVNGTNTSYTVSGIAASHTVTVEFELIPQTTYNVTVNNGTGGGNFAAGSTVNITANAPPAGQEFDKWTTADGVTFANATSASTTFQMPAKAVTVTATYKALTPITYTITVQNDNNGTASANLTFAATGTEITLTATPKSGYRFKEWQVISGGITVTNNKFAMPASVVTIKAIFEIIPITTYTIKATAGTGGKVSGGGTVNANASVTLIATIDNGYVFDGWYENNIKVSGAAVYTFTATANRTLEARFNVSKFYQSFIDEEVKMWADEGVIPDGATFTVNKIMPPPADVTEKVSDQLGAGAIIIAYYEITLKDSDGNLITQLNGEITIGTKLPEGYESGTGVKIYQEDENGILVEMESWVEDGYIFYKTIWLEIY